MDPLNLEPTRWVAPKEEPRPWILRLRPWFKPKGALVAFIACICVAGLLGGYKASAGMALALASTTLNIWVLARITGYLAGQHQPEKPLWSTLFLVAALFVKLPIFMLFVIFAYRIGGTALSGFGAGILLVYCALVGWSLVKAE